MGSTTVLGEGITHLILIIIGSYLVAWILARVVRWSGFLSQKQELRTRRFLLAFLITGQILLHFIPIPFQNSDFERATGHALPPEARIRDAESVSLWQRLWQPDWPAEGSVDIPPAVFDEVLVWMMADTAEFGLMSYTLEGVSHTRAWMDQPSHQYPNVLGAERLVFTRHSPQWHSSQSVRVILDRRMGIVFIEPREIQLN